jgi:hypothetical protein
MTGNDEEARLRVVLRSTRLPVRMQYMAARRIATNLNAGFTRRPTTKSNHVPVVRTRRPADQYPNGCVCPITLEPFRDPVVCTDGQSYERAAIEKWLRTHGTSPVLGTPMPAKTIPNVNLRIILDDMDARASLDVESDASASR